MAPGPEQLNMGQEALKSKMAQVREQDQAELELARKTETYVQPDWEVIIKPLEYRASLERIKTELRTAASRGRLELSGDFVWGVDEYEHSRYWKFAQPQGYGQDNESRQRIRDLYKARFGEWFRQNVSDDLNVDIDRHGNIILTWEVPEAAR